MKPLPEHNPAQSPSHGAVTPSARVLCPYCGHTQSVARQCVNCRGLFDLQSRQATQNAMGPWFIRNESSSFQPGCSYETLRDLVSRGRLNRETIIRGPTTRQFWNMAANTPGVAVLLGECHACHQPAHPDDYLCPHCGVSLSPPTDRQHMGLLPVRPAVPTRAATSVPSPQQVRPEALERPLVPPIPGGPPDPAPDSSGFTEELLRRRSERERRALRRRRAAIWVMLLGVVGLGAIAAILRGEPPAGRAVPQPTTPEAAPASMLERFRTDLERARTLSESGITSDIDEAIEVLSRVRAAAGDPAGQDDRDFVSKLDDTIDRLRRKMDDARLRDALK